MLSLSAAFHINFSFVALPYSNTPLSFETAKDRAVDAGIKRITPVPSVSYSPEILPVSKRKRKKKADSVSIGKFKLTAYCPCRKCSDGYGNRTSTGVKAKEGRTIAVDPDVIPYGTKVYIKGSGEFVAEDCGGGVKGKHIDVYFNSHRKAVKFGVKYRKVERRW